MSIKTMTFSAIVVAGAKASICNPEKIKKQCLLATATTGFEAFETDDYDDKKHTLNDFVDEEVISNMRISSMKLCTYAPHEEVRGWSFTLSDDNGNNVTLPYIGRK